MKMFHSLPQWAQIGFIIGAIFGLLFLVLGITQAIAGVSVMATVFSFVIAVVWFAITWFIAMRGSHHHMMSHTDMPHNLTPSI